MDVYERLRQSEQSRRLAWQVLQEIRLVLEILRDQRIPCEGNAMQMSSPFFPLHEIEVRAQQQSAPLTVQQIIQQLNQLPQAGVPVNLSNPANAQQVVNLAAAISQTLSNPSRKVRLEKLPGVYVESPGLTHVFLTDLTIERNTINTPSGPQDGIKTEILWQRWETFAASLG